jgi:PKD repeat protein
MKGEGEKMKFSRFARSTAIGMSLLMLSATGVWADVINPLDGDTLNNPSNIHYALSPSQQQRACTARGEEVPGTATLVYQGSQHFAPNQSLSLSATTPSGVTVTFLDGDGNATTTYALGAWSSGSANKVINFKTVVNSTSAGGEVTILISGAGVNNSGNPVSGGHAASSAFNVIVECTATNQAPVVSAAFTADTVNCQNQATLRASFTDSDSTSWTYSVDWDYDLATFDGSTPAAVTSNPFDLTHTYADPGTYMAGVQVIDNQGAASNIATDSIDVLQTYSNSFLQPIDNLQTTGKKNTFKNGRVIPVKVTITDGCTGLAVTGDTGEVVTASLTKTPVAGSGTDAIETFADAGASSGNTDLFRWSLDGFWIYNLDSKALGMASSSTYELKVLVDGIAAEFSAALQPTK